MHYFLTVVILAATAAVYHWLWFTVETEYVVTNRRRSYAVVSTDRGGS